jgi:hypothetical protein
MSRGLPAVITGALVVVATAAGVVIVNQDWGLAATALVGFGIVAALATFGVCVAVFLFRRQGPADDSPARAPAIHA